MKIRHILLLILYVSLLSACTQKQIRSHAMTLAKPWTITLLVTGNAGTADMKVNTGPMPSCGHGPDGCMVFTAGEKGVVTFDMSGNDSGFHITQLKICKGETPPDPLDADCPLSLNALDFYVLDTDGNATVPNFLTGKVEWTYADAIKTFVLHDRNLLSQKYYYLVMACDGPTPPLDKCVTADPPLDNKGLH